MAWMDVAVGHWESLKLNHKAKVKGMTQQDAGPIE